MKCGMRRQITRVRWLADENVKFRKSNMADAAILKIVISPYLSLESSEYNEIWYAYAYFDRIDRNVRKIQKFPNSRWRTDAILKIIFWL